MLAWRIFGVPRVSVFLSLARSKMAIVRLPRDLPKNYLFFVFTSVEGKGTPLPFGFPPPIIWLHFLLPLPMSGDPRSLRCEHLCDPHSLITVTFWLLDNVSSTGGGSIIPTSSSPWAITWHLFKEFQQMPVNRNLRKSQGNGYVVKRTNTIHTMTNK